MFYIIADVLDGTAVAEAVSVLERAAFVDGRATAGWHAARVKNNLQAPPGDPGVDALRATLAARIADNPMFQAAARPKALSPLILSLNANMPTLTPAFQFAVFIDSAPSACSCCAVSLCGTPHRRFRTTGALTHLHMED